MVQTHRTLADEALRRELLRRREADQAPYRRLPEQAVLMEEMLQIFAENIEWLKRVVDERGWPGRRLAGEDGADAAWLIVQHSDDLDFQRKCLELIGAGMQAGDVSPSHLAYLMDRVLVREGRFQRYGTQFREGESGMEPFPIAELEHVDKRRAAVGLIPLAAYAAGFKNLPWKR